MQAEPDTVMTGVAVIRGDKREDGETSVKSGVKPGGELEAIPVSGELDRLPAPERVLIQGGSIAR